jgi:hypothetical protein
MKKPIKPEQMIWAESSNTIHCSNRMPLDLFMKELPVQSNFVKEIMVFTLDDNGDCLGVPYIEITWKELVKNIYYDREMKKYEAKMKKWKKQNDDKKE